MVPRFAELVLGRFPALAAFDRTVCVVGRRRRGGEFKADRFPVSLADYWAEFDPNISQLPPNSNALLYFVVAARCEAERSKIGADAARIVYTGILDFIALSGEKHSPKSRRRLQEHLIAQGRFPGFKRAIWRLIDPRVSLTKEMWATEIADLVASLASVLPADLPDGAIEHLAWQDGVVPTVAPVGRSYQNIYVHESGGRRLPIRFETIHAVKGETHTATLLVETFSKNAHDLKALLPVFTGELHGSQLPAGKLNCCMCAFVALTRPSGMISLAMAAEHVSAAAVGKLQARGWTIEMLGD